MLVLFGLAIVLCGVYVRACVWCVTCLAPDVLVGKPYHAVVDEWSIGVMTYCLYVIKFTVITNSLCCLFCGCNSCCY